MSTLIANTLQGINTIKYDGSTTAMTIDSAGRMGVSNPIYVWARRSSGNLSADGNIVWNTEMIDTASAYNNTTGIFTCPRDGHYEVHWHYLHRFNGYIRTTLLKNGSYVWGSSSATVLYSNNNDSGDEQQVSAFGIVNCSANDTLYIVISGRSGAADIYGSSNSHNGFMVKFLG